MKDDYFWPSYSDLMTALFFVMLVLYILTFVKLKHDQEKFRVSAKKYDKLLAIEKSLSSLDKDLFDFDSKNKRYKLKTEATFNSGSCDIDDLSGSQLFKLKRAGNNIYTLLKELGRQDASVSYLLVLEGNTARSLDGGSWNYEVMPDRGYELSYCRALSLFNYWASKGYDFRTLDNCEVMIAGSGYFGKSREEKERKNKRFTIQITGKLGEFK